MLKLIKSNLGHKKTVKSGFSYHNVICSFGQMKLKNGTNVMLLIKDGHQDFRQLDLAKESK